MATRFTQTEKWEDKWFRSLPPYQKLIFDYLCDKCDLAGFIEIDEEQIAFDTQIPKEHISGAIEGLNRGYIASEGWVWIKNFLRHQKNLPLNPLNNAHKHIINLISYQLSRFKLTEIGGILGVDQGLFSPIGKVKVKYSKVDRGKTEINIGFENFWNLYNKKMGDKPLCEKKWHNLSDDERNKIMEILPKWKNKYAKDKQYQPYPEAFLNQRRWNDDLTEESKEEIKKANLTLKPGEFDELFTKG